MDKPISLTYTHAGLVDAILTPVELFSDLYKETTSYSTNALWDTGAMLSVISPEIAKKLLLDTVDTIQIMGINGESVAEVTVISIRFPNNAIIKDVRAAICSMSPDNGMIIGMDVITQMDIAITNGGGKTQFSFAIPPFKDRIDFSDTSCRA
ncbi:MAG: retropepsin-like domain-containing protein [Treponema sp.]|nr:retropepsin-like domain-containing protein [Treponema sp.]